MGLLGKLFGRGEPSTPAQPSTAPPPSSEDQATQLIEPEAPPTACVVLRQGMDLPDEAYLRAVAEAEKPGMVEAGMLVRGLSQPRWFAKDEWMESGARIVADAFEKELGIDPGKTGYWKSTGPDGANILVVFLRR